MRQRAFPWSKKRPLARRLSLRSTLLAHVEQHPQYPPYATVACLDDLAAVGADDAAQVATWQHVGVTLVEFTELLTAAVALGNVKHGVLKVMPPCLFAGMDAASAQPLNPLPLDHLFEPHRRGIAAPFAVLLVTALRWIP